MTREQKIDTLLAFLAPLIFEGKNNETAPAPQITFFSATEVQIEEFPGTLLPVNKEYTDNPLKELLEKIADYNDRDERKNWEECCLEEGFTGNDETDLEDTYNPLFCPDHIYHTIRQLQELSEDSKQEESGCDNKVLRDECLESKLYRKVHEEANLGYKYLLIYRDKKGLEEALDGKIYAISNTDGTFLCDLLESDFLQLQDDLTILDSLSMPKGVNYCTDWAVSNDNDRGKVFSRRIVVLFTNDLN